MIYTNFFETDIEEYKPDEKYSNFETELLQCNTKQMFEICKKLYRILDKYHTYGSVSICENDAEYFWTTLNSLGENNVD